MSSPDLDRAVLAGVLQKLTAVGQPLVDVRFRRRRADGRDARLHDGREDKRAGGSGRGS
jgi:hypothetical protein